MCTIKANISDLTKELKTIQDQAHKTRQEHLLERAKFWTQKSQSKIAGIVRSISNAEGMATSYKKFQLSTKHQEPLDSPLLQFQQTVIALEYKSWMWKKWSKMNFKPL